MKDSFWQLMRFRVQTMWRRIVSAIHQERSQELFTFLGFVLLALVFWFLQGLSDEVEATFEIPIEVQNTPEGDVPVEELPSFVEVRIRDKASSVWRYRISGVSSMRINYQEYAQGRNTFVLNAAQLRGILRNSLRPSSKVVSLSIDTLRISYASKTGKWVKVVVKSEVTTSSKSVLSGDIKADNDSVLLYGATGDLARIQEVYTEEIHEKRLTDTLYKEVKIVPIPNVRIVPDKVTVTIPVEELVNKTFEVPVTPQKLPDNERITMFPSVVKLSCRVPAGKLPEVDASSFLVGADYQSQRNGRLKISIVEAPSFVYHATLLQDSVDFVLIGLPRFMESKR